MSSAIGLNAAIRYVKDYNRLVSYSQRLNATYNVAYIDKHDHATYAKQFADTQAGKTVVRVWHPLDGAFHLKPSAAGDERHYITTPAEYLDSLGQYGLDKMILNVLNEPNAFAQPADVIRLITWLAELLTIAARRKIQLVVPNWGDRHPRLVNGEWEAVYDDILHIMAGYPDLFYMGMHLYGDDNLTEHLDGYVRRCKTLGITPLHVIATEWGVDSTGGQETGYKSRGWSGKQYANWMIGQVKGGLKPFIDSGILVGLCTFTYGNSGGWDAFDVENDNEFLSALELAAKMGDLLPVSTKPLPPKPVTIIEKPEAAIIGIRQIINSFGAGYTAYRHLRIEPRWDATETAQVYKENIIRVYTIPVMTGAINASGALGRWNYVEKLDSEKNIVASGWLWVDKMTFANNSTSTNENPVVKPDSPTDTQNPAKPPLQPITGLTRELIDRWIAAKELELGVLRELRDSLLLAA